jgi:endonuclease/exonuclease/phosphatase family metal-dependent hydrolase
MASQPTYRVLEYFKRWGNPLTGMDNYPSRVQEIAYRSFGPAALLGAAVYLSRQVSPMFGLLTVGGLMALEGARTALHLLAFASQKKNYIHVRSQASEISSARPRVATWNLLGFPAGMNYTCGGTSPFRNRFPGIAKRIRQEDPDIVILQECVIDVLTIEAIIKEFKDKYAHFFIHNGPNKWGIESGLLIMTNCAVLDYTFTPFETNDWTMTRGFATLKIPQQHGRPAFAVIGTHMEAGGSEKDTLKRTQQLAQIYKHAQSLTDVDAVVLAGDLNIDAALEKDRIQTKIDEVLVDIHKDGEPTCTNEFNWLRYPHKRGKAPKSEYVDQIALIRRTGADAERKIVQNLKVIPVYTNTQGVPDSKTALSDHNPVFADLIWESK